MWTVYEYLWVCCESFQKQISDKEWGVKLLSCWLKTRNDATVRVTLTTRLHSSSNANATGGRGCAHSKNGTHQEAHDGGHVAAEAGGVDGARVKGDPHDARARQPLAQLEHEQHDGQFAQHQRLYWAVRAGLLQLHGVRSLNAYRVT